jgi:acyl carrier protein
MTRDEIRQAVIEALTSIAPEIDSNTLQGNTALRQELDLDSMDFLNFIIALHGSTGVDIPETDYTKLGTIEDAVQYIEHKSNASVPRTP